MTEAEKLIEKAERMADEDMPAVGVLIWAGIVVLVLSLVAAVANAAEVSQPEIDAICREARINGDPIPGFCTTIPNDWESVFDCAVHPLASEHRPYCGWLWHVCSNDRNLCPQNFPPQGQPSGTVEPAAPAAARHDEQ